MAISSSQFENTSFTEKEPRLVDLRFSLRHLMSGTALADIFWASDLHGATNITPEKNVLVLIVNPSLTSLSGFVSAWRKILDRPAPAATAYPDIVAFGEDNGDYWLALSNINGMLLSEDINELNQRGLPLHTALDTLNNIYQSLSSIQAGAFGYIEPGALQRTDRGDYKILNAPLVKIMQLLTASRQGAINKLALHSSYLSPSVAVGDVPVTEDDTFSCASLLYTLLAGKAPFGGQSTLTAVAHGDTPPQLKQLPKTSWETLQQSLTYQRSARPENPEKLLALLQKSRKKRLVFPAAVLTAVGVSVFAGQHLVNQLSGYLKTSDHLRQYQQTSDLLAPQPKETPIPTTTQAKANDDSQNNAKEKDKQAAIAEIKLVNEPENAIPDEKSTQSPVSQVTEATPLSAKTNGADSDTPDIPAANIKLTQQSDADTDDNNDTQTKTAETPALPKTKVTDKTQSELQKQNDTGKILRTNQAEASVVAAEATKKEEKAALATTAEEENKKAIDQTLKQVVATFNIGQLEDSETGKKGAISLIREVLKVDDENPEALTLLGKVIEKKYHAAEKKLAKRDFTAAEALLVDSDKLIREFTLTERLQRQVKMESKILILNEEQKQVDELLKSAKASINRGSISKDDGDNNALSFLSRVMFKQPGNTEGKKLLTEIVSIRQQATHRAINNGEIEQAGTYLSESKRLIRKYKLKQAKADQQALENQYKALMTQAVVEPPVDNTIEILPLPAEQTQMPQNNANTGTNPITTAVPTEKLLPNTIAIQDTVLGDLTDVAPQEIQPGQAFFPDTDTIAVPSAQALPIWEDQNLQQMQQSDQVAQAVLTYQPALPATEQAQQPMANQLNQPIAANQAQIITQPSVTYISSEQSELPVVDFQTQANGQNGELQMEEIIPELQEIPITAIQDILPTQ